MFNPRLNESLHIDRIGTPDYLIFDLWEKLCESCRSRDLCEKLGKPESLNGCEWYLEKVKVKQT